jgi:hypothetical protein
MLDVRAYCTSRTQPRAVAGATMNSAGDRLHSGGLRSLWDMINFDFTEAHAALELLNYEYRDALQKSLETRKAILVQYVNDEDKAKALKFVAHCGLSLSAIAVAPIENRNRPTVSRLFRTDDIVALLALGHDAAVVRNIARGVDRRGPDGSLGRLL